MKVFNDGPYLRVLGIAEFRALAVARLISMLGDSAAYLAVTVLVYQRTGSALLASLTFAVSFVPYLFGGLLVSALVDRIPARRLIVTTDLAAGFLVAGLVIPVAPIGLVFVALFGIAVMSPVRGGIIDALVVEILPGDLYVTGRSIQRIIAQGAQIVGIGMGGLLIAPVGPHGALLIDTMSFLASALIIWRGVRAREMVQNGSRPRLITDSLSGITAVWAQRAIRRRLLLGWLVPFLAVAPEALAAPVVSEAGKPVGLIGVWLMAIPLGMIVGDLIAIWSLSARTRLLLTWPLAMAIPLLLCLFAFRPAFLLAIILLVASGLCSAYSLGLDQSLRDVTPKALLGRTFALNSTGLMVSQGLGFVSAGWLADMSSPPTAIALTGAVGFLLVLCLPVHANDRHVIRHPDPAYRARHL